MQIADLPFAFGLFFCFIDLDKNRGKEKEDDCIVSSAGKKRKISCENAPAEDSENDLMSVSPCHSCITISVMGEY